MLAPAVLERLRPLGYTGGVTILRDRLRRLRPRGHREAFLTLDFAPGEAMQVDWADFGFALPGVPRRVSAFVAVLCHSRHLYIEFTVSQAMGSFLRCMDRCLHFFAGTTAVDIYDYVARHVIEVLCPTRLRGRVRELCELNARSSRTRPHIRLECVEPGEQALVGPPDGFSREWRRSCGRRLARLQRRLLRAHVDLGVAVGRVQADVAQPTADHVDFYAGLEQVYGRRVTVMPSSA